MSESEEKDKDSTRAKSKLEQVVELQQNINKRGDILVKQKKSFLVECILRQQVLLDRLSNEVQLLSETNSRLTVELLLKQRLEVDFRKFFFSV